VLPGTYPMPPLPGTRQFDEANQIMGFPQMRLINILVFISTTAAALWTFMIVYALALIFARLIFTNDVHSALGAIFRFVVPQVLILYTVLFASGGVLARQLKTDVPLKWCLALGLVFATGNFSIVLKARVTSPIEVTFMGLFCTGMLILPVFGGYWRKHCCKDN
jgi:hypothetical protein